MKNTRTGHRDEDRLSQSGKEAVMRYREFEYGKNDRFKAHQFVLVSQAPRFGRRYYCFLLPSSCCWILLFFLPFDVEDSSVSDPASSHDDAIARITAVQEAEKK